MPKTLITGAAGFVGRHLAQQLVARGDEVFGTFLDTPPPVAGVTWLELALGDAARSRALLASLQPEAIYHLASPSHVATANADPEKTIDAIVLGTLHLLHAAAALPKPPRFLYVSSAEEYGDGERSSEDSPLAPRSLYGIAKMTACRLALQMRDVLPVIAVRPFNQIGPGQSPDFAIASFAQQIAAIVAGQAPPVVRTGNLSVARDFIDVEDSANGHIAALQSGQSGQVYNICSGVGTELGTLLNAMIAASGRSIAIETDSARVRSEVPLRVGTNDKLAALGWAPRSTPEAAAVRCLQAVLAKLRVL